MARVQNEMVWTQRSSNYDDYRGRIAELRPLNCFICRCACFDVSFCSEVSGIACNCQLSTQVTHKGSKLLKSAKNKFTWQCDFTFFSSKFQQIYIISVSCDCICMSKTLQTVEWIRIISHFIPFFILISGGFYSFKTTVHKTRKRGFAASF